jgi:hypothetical protein
VLEARGKNADKMFLLITTKITLQARSVFGDYKILRERLVPMVANGLVIEELAKS